MSVTVRERDTDDTKIPLADQRVISIFYSFSAGIDFKGQNLTSIDVRF